LVYYYYSLTACPLIRADIAKSSVAHILHYYVLYGCVCTHHQLHIHAIVIIERSQVNAPSNRYDAIVAKLIFTKVFCRRISGMGNNLRI
jgi:hypothetical protein